MRRPRWPALWPALYLCIGLALMATGADWEMTPPLVRDAPDAVWWHVVPLAVSCAGLWLQRRRMMAGFALTWTAVLADTALGLHLGVFLAWTDALYAVARRAPARPRRTGLVLSAVAVAGIWALLVIPPGGGEYALPLGLTLTVGMALPLWWGAEVRNGHERAARADTAARLERERSETARRTAELDRAEAVQRERTAMARELHDTVSAHLTGIALQAAAALSGPPTPPRTAAP